MLNKMTGLAEILEKEPQIKRLHERWNSIKFDPERDEDYYNKQQRIMPEMESHIVQLYQLFTPEQLALYADILHAGIDNLETKKIFTVYALKSDEEELLDQSHYLISRTLDYAQPSSLDGAMLVSDPEFNTLLKACNLMIRKGMRRTMPEGFFDPNKMTLEVPFRKDDFSDEEMFFTAASVLTEGPAFLKYLRHTLSENSVNSFVSFMINNGWRSFPDLIKIIQHSHEDINKIIQAGYTPQLEKMLSLMGDRKEGMAAHSIDVVMSMGGGEGEVIPYADETFNRMVMLNRQREVQISHRIRNGAFIAKSILIGELVELCDNLKAEGMLDYYDKLIDRFKQIPELDATSLLIFMEGKYGHMAKVIKSYQEAGLDFFETFDWLAKLYNPSYKRDIASRDMCFDFLEQFPEEHKVHGDKIYEIFEQTYHSVKNKYIWPSMSVAIRKFLNEKYDKRFNRRYSLEEWIDFAGELLKRKRSPMDAEVWVPMTFLVMENQIDFANFLECFDKMYENRMVPQTDDTHNMNFPRPMVDDSELLDNLKLTRPIIMASADLETRHRYLDYFEILGMVPETPNPRCDESWLKKTAENLGRDYVQLKTWLDKVTDEKNSIRQECDEARKPQRETRELMRLRQDLQRKLSEFNAYFRTIPDILGYGIDFEKYDSLFEFMDKKKIPSNLQGAAPLINSDADRAVKELYLSYFGILKGVHGLPEARCDDSWLKEVAQKIKMDYTAFKGWIDSIISEQERIPAETEKWRALDEEGIEGVRRGMMLDELQKNLIDLESYISHVPEIIENDIDLVDSFRLRGKYIHSGEIVYLKELFNADRPLGLKLYLLEKIKENRNVLHYLPPTAEDLDDIDGWMARAKQATSEQVSREAQDLGIEEEILLTIIRNIKTPQSREDLKTLASLKASGQDIKALFKLGAVYATKKVYGLEEKVDPVDATRLLFQGLISRNSGRVAEAMQYYDAAKMSMARNYVESSNIPPSSFFHAFQREIMAISGNTGRDEKMHYCQFILNGLKEAYLKSSKYSQGKAALNELVFLVESLYKQGEVFNAITAKMQDGVIEDLGDGGRLKCCAFMSKDREKSEVEALYYLLDPYIALLHTVPSWAGEYSLPIGAGILVNAQTMNGKRVLLVDSVEGGDQYQAIRQSETFELAMKGIVGAAIDTESGYVMINGGIGDGNSVAKSFPSYIRNMLGISESTVDLTKMGLDEQLTPRKKRFLDSFKDREKLAGPVTGYLVRTEDLVKVAK